MRSVSPAGACMTRPATTMDQQADRVYTALATAADDDPPRPRQPDSQDRCHHLEGERGRPPVKGSEIASWQKRAVGKPVPLCIDCWSANTRETAGSRTTVGTLF